MATSLSWFFFPFRTRMHSLVCDSQKPQRKERGEKKEEKEEEEEKEIWLLPFLLFSLCLAHEPVDCLAVGLRLLSWYKK